MATEPMLDLDRYADPLAWIDSRGDAMIEQVQAWSAINSGSGNLAGLTEMGVALKEAFAELDAREDVIELGDATRVTDAGETEPLPLGPVYRFRKRADAPRRVLLTGHIDTVFPADHPFQAPRFKDAGTLNGPGVADMKGGLLVMLHGLLALERSPAAAGVGWEVLVSSDEEIGSLGSAAVLAERAPHAHIGLTYEPALADGTLAGARKGSGNFTIVVRGRAAHAGREFDKGRNAVAALAEIVGGLNALNGQRGGITVNPAQISGGTAPNIVPDTAVLRFNARVESDDDARWVEDRVARLIEPVGAREGYAVALHGSFNRPPKPLTARNERLFQAVQAAGAALELDIAYRATGGCCEGNNLAAAGLANVDTLGVRGGKIHSAEEFALTDSFTERAKLSALILMGFADGRFDALFDGGASV